MRIGFVGAGKMGLALAKGVDQSRFQCSIAISDPSVEARSLFLSQLNHVKVMPDNLSLCLASDVVFLACKPQQLSSAMESLPPSEDGPLYISILAGTPVEKLTRLLRSSRVIRAMPNTPCLIGKGALGVAINHSVSAADQGLAERLLRGVGVVLEVEESMLDAVTGVSGSGPAYVYKFMEAMIHSAVQAGLDAEVARRLVVETVIGAGEMVKSTGEDPEVLRGHVSSPGGTTVAGLSIMDELGFGHVIHSAVQAAIERSQELAKA